MSNDTTTSSNRTPLIIGVVVVFLCLCAGLGIVGVGAYFVVTNNSGPLVPVANATAVPPIAPVFPTFSNPNVNPPTFPTIVGGGTCDEVEEFDDQGYDHIRPNEAHPRYNSDPPTSGPHWANPQEWGIYSTPQVQEQLVHNLEHGGIVIQYNNLSNAELQRIIDFVRRTPRHIIVAPYPGLPRGVRVVFTAWTYLQACDGVDLEALSDFVDEFRDQGPEFIP